MSEAEKDRGEERRVEQREKINVKTEEIKKEGVAAVETLPHLLLSKKNKKSPQSPMIPQHIKHCIGYTPKSMSELDS